MSSELVVAGVGEIVNLDDANQCANALVAIRGLESQLREAKALLTEAIVAECARMGTKTLELPSGTKAVVSGGMETVWDIETLETLLDAGLPPERYADLVTEEVSFKVNASVAKSIAAANEQYAAIVGRARTEVEKPRYVSLKRR